MTNSPDSQYAPPSADPNRLASDSLLHQARLKHGELLREMPGVQAIDQDATDFDLGSSLVFKKDAAGEIAHPLDFDFEAHGLPQPPAGEVPLALLTTRGPVSGQLRSVGLLAYGNGSSNGGRKEPYVYYLEDHEQDVDSTILKPQWSYPGHARKTAEHYRPKAKVDNNETVRLDVEWSGYPGDVQPTDIRILRPQISKSEAAILKVPEADRRQRRLRKARRWLAPVVLASTLAGATYHTEYTPPPPAHYSDQIGDQNAVKRVEENLRLFKSGNTKALDREIAHSKFAKELLPSQDLRDVQRATSLGQINKLISRDLAPLGIRFTLERQYMPGDFTGVRAKDLATAKQTALGILDGLRELNDIVRDGTTFDLEMVGTITSDKDTDGLYVYSTNSSQTPEIRIELIKNRQEAASTLEHEDGHLQNLTDSGIGEGFVNLEDSHFQYGDNKSGNGKVGRDIVDAYAGTDADEDAADMQMYLFSHPKLDLEHDSMLQEKLKYVMASLEQEYPGASAVILRHAQNAKMGRTNGVEKTLNELQSYAKDVFMASVLLSIGLALASKKNKDLMKTQKVAELR